MRAKAMLSLFLLFCIALCCIGTNIYSGRSGVSTLRNELDSARENQQGISDGNEAGTGAGNVTEGIGALERAAQSIREGQRDAAAIIGECQSILGEIRARGEKQNRLIKGQRLLAYILLAGVVLLSVSG